MQRIQNWLAQWVKTPAGLLTAALILGAIAIMAFSPGKAKAEGIQNKPAANPLAEIVPKPGNWSGCGPAIRAGWLIGAADFSPVTVSSEGGTLGIGFGCDWQAGKHFLVGAFVSWDKAFNDLHTLGVNTDLTAGMRVGYVFNTNVMAYGGAAWSRVNVDGIGDVDGYKLLAGLEAKLSSTAPWFADLEVSRGFYGNVAGSSIDVNSTAVTLALKYKFGAK